MTTRTATPILEAAPVDKDVVCGCCGGVNYDSSVAPNVGPIYELAIGMQHSPSDSYTRRHRICQTDLDSLRNVLAALPWGSSR